MGKDNIVKSIINDLVNRFSDNIIAIYGIGSYFDDSLPSGWKKNDLDLLVLVKLLELIPKQEWTEIRYEVQKRNENHVWCGFNTIEAFQNRDNFSKESFSNYEWSLIELKHPTNSKLLYGKDIRAQLPETNNLKFNYDDILARGLYHLEKSLSEQDSDSAQKEFSKAIFKTIYYVCIFLDPTYRKTSIIENGTYLKNLTIDNNVLEKMIEFFEEALIFRIMGQYKSDFEVLSNEFVSYMVNLLKSGSLHRKIQDEDLKRYLAKSFSGFPYLIQKIRKLKLY